MTTTICITEKNGEKKRLQFMTIPTVGGIHVDIRLLNEDFVPIGMSNFGESPTITDEVEYHTKLRVEASGRDQFVPDHSTDHHLNPGYIELEEPLTPLDHEPTL